MITRPKKFLGQHFLTATRYAERIASAIPAISTDSLLEIGAGYGALSRFLLPRFPAMHIIELDNEAIEQLITRLRAGEWKLHRGDVLEFDFAQAGFPLHVTGNLPYSIASMIIKKTLLYGNNIASVTFMVQREVATRICAGPGGKQSGFLSIFSQFFGTPKILFHLPCGAFFPPPKVESAVFQIIISPDLNAKLPRNEWEDFFAFVDCGFSQRRKMVAKVLGADGTKSRYEDLLIRIGAHPTDRPESLGVKQWLALYIHSRDEGVLPSKLKSGRHSPLCEAQ